MSRKTSSLRQQCGPGVLFVGVVLAWLCPARAGARRRRRPSAGAGRPADRPPRSTRTTRACAGGVVVAPHGTEGSVVVPRHRRSTPTTPDTPDSPVTCGAGTEPAPRPASNRQRRRRSHVTTPAPSPGRVAYAGARRRGATRGTTRETGSHSATAGNAELESEDQDDARGEPHGTRERPPPPSRRRAGSGCPSRASSGSRTPWPTQRRAPGRGRSPARRVWSRQPDGRSHRAPDREGNVSAARFSPGPGSLRGRHVVRAPF